MDTYEILISAFHRGCGFSLSICTCGKVTVAIEIAFKPSSRFLKSTIVRKPLFSDCASGPKTFSIRRLQYFTGC